jgi:hypothetical protein
MLNRLSYIFLLGVLALAAFIYINYSRDSDDLVPQFTGVNRCRVCHEAASAGAQFRIWEDGPHATAYKTLQSDSAKQYIARHNLTVDSCLSCHTTLGRPAANADEQGLMVEGVGCERCHGPGSHYAFFNVMRDRSAFTARGGGIGTLKDCYQCHASDPAKVDEPCPFQHEKFNADSAWSDIRHPLFKNNTASDTVINLRDQ